MRAFFLLTLCAVLCAQPKYDILLKGGHLIDPKNKISAPRDVAIKDGKVSDIRFKLMPVFSDAIAPDADMAALISKARAPFAADLGKEIGRTDSLLYRRGNFNGSFDDLICDAMLSQRDAEIALSPGFRWGGSLLPGGAQSASEAAITHTCSDTRVWLSTGTLCV